MMISQGKITAKFDKILLLSLSYFKYVLLICCINSSERGCIIKVNYMILEKKLTLIFTKVHMECNILRYDTGGQDMCKMCINIFVQFAFFLL